VAVGGARLPSLLQEWHAARPRPRSRKRDRPRSGSGTEALCVRTRTQSSRSNAFPESHAPRAQHGPCSRHTAGIQGQPCREFIIFHKIQKPLTEPQSPVSSAAVQPGIFAQPQPRGVTWRCSASRLLAPGARRPEADQLRDHTGQKRPYWLVLKEIIRAAPCFFLHVLAWY
jgi:hypothetical protein